MRSWSCALALVAVLASVTCQRREQGGTNTNTRLGLISSTLGLPPVPGGSSVNVLPHQPPAGCYCLPINQACPNQPIPPQNGGSGGTSGAGIFDVRIVNRPQGGRCPNPEEHLCCITGRNPGVPRPVNPNPVPFNPNPRPVNPNPVPFNPNPRPVNPNPVPFNPNPFPVRPNPVVPSPIQIGSCGVSNPIPYRQAQYAEAQFAEYPWMAVILDLGDRYLGGGALISSEWVLTAAHKVHSSQNMKVRLGEHDVKQTLDNPQFPHLEVRIDRIIVHPNFNSQTLANDVALLHLSQPVNTQSYPHIGTVCLPEQNQLFHGQSCWVTGFGKDAFEQTGSFQNILKEVDVPIVDPFACEASLRNSRLGQSFVLDKQSFVCAGGIQGKDACTGDGGAPLVCRTRNGWTVVGLVAWGIGCAQNQLPGVYVNVPNFINFIRQYVRH